MKFLLVTTFFTLASAHSLHHGVRHKRQVVAVGASSSASGILPPLPSSAVAFSAVASSVLATSPTLTTSTAVAVLPATTTAAPVTPLGPGTDIPPLASITSGEPPEATASLTTTYLPGATPTYIPGAPPLPAFTLTPTDWPKMDWTPPTNSTQVQQWMQEIAGFYIPDIPPTVNGSCALSPTAAANAQANGWWTCGGWTRPTDVVACPDKYTWGVSFDDGPAYYTPKLLNFLAEKDILATFYTVGSRVLEFPLTLQQEYMAGHEISVHTWSHPPLTSLTNEQIVAELGWTKLIIQTVLGVTPTFMRPPYGDIDDRVRAISLAMGLQPAIWTRGPTGEQFDTEDWQIPGGVVTGEESYAAFQYILGNASLIDTGFIVLEHDLYQQTVDMAIGYTLPTALNNTPALTLEPIGTCNGWPASNMYLETTTNTTFPYLNSSSSVASTTAPARAAAATAAGAGAADGGSDSSSASGALPVTMDKFVAGVAGVFIMLIGMMALESF